MTTEKKEEIKINKKQKEKIEKLLNAVCKNCQNKLKLKAIEIQQELRETVYVWFVYSNDKCADDGLCHSHETLTKNEFEYIKTKVSNNTVKETIGLW